MGAAMKWGLEQKLILVLVALLSVTITSLALLASYSTARQNEAAAFANLDRDLQTWQTDLADSVAHLRDVALREVNDPASMASLSRLLALQFKIAETAHSIELSRTLGYQKSVALARMLLILRTGGFNSIAVYTRGRLSHLVSTSRSGMMLASTAHGEVWISAAADVHGALPLQSWPSWQPDVPPQDVALTVTSPTLPTVSFTFPTPEATAIQITIPVLGRAQAISPDWDETADRFVSDLTVAGSEPGEFAEAPVPLAVIIFSKLIDRAVLQDIYDRTGDWASLYSPQSNHIQQLAVSLPLGAQLSSRFGTSSQPVHASILHRQVNTRTDSFYQALMQWRFDHQSPFVMGLASSRQATLHNVRQTLSTILLVAVGILVLSVAVGAFWVRRFIDPIVALTGAAKAIGSKRYTGAIANITAATELRPLNIEASDEVGELANAFNAMIAELRRSIETLEQRVQERSLEALKLAHARSDFLAQMSHELRTPLNAILGYAQILLRNPQPDARQARALSTIQESGLHLLTLINDILDLARMEAAKLELVPHEVVLSIFLQGLTNIIEVKAHEKNLRFVLEAASDLPHAVRVDEKRLRQILLNLLGNAIKFTDAGSVTLRVQSFEPLEKSTDPAPAVRHVRLRFEVEDTGIGIPVEQQSRLFQPFAQLGEFKRREGGSGLGLAISNALMNLMGGKIGLHSEPGKGSRFWIELDLPRAAGADVVSPRRVVTSYEGSEKKILVVDDVTHSRAMLVETLEGLGFTVSDAASGRDAIERVPVLKPDLVLMDLMMPGMDGTEAIRQIRQLPGFEQLPIIVVSASAGPDEQSRSLESGANGFLSKPVDHVLLLQAVGKELGIQWSYREPVLSVQTAELNSFRTST